VFLFVGGVSMVRRLTTDSTPSRLRPPPPNVAATTVPTKARQANPYGGPFEITPTQSVEQMER
jgi:hypothetical protein